MSRADYLARTGMDRPRPGGRWHASLRVLAAGPMVFGDLYRATDTGRHHGRLGRDKLRRALKDLAALELVERIEPWGWAITAEGSATLVDLNDQEERACAA